jgi:hypothetical protein
LAGLVPPLSWTGLRNGFVFLASSLAIGGLVFAAWTGIPKLRAWADARERVDPAHLRVRFEPSPQWMPKSSLEALRADAREALDGTSVLDGSALETVHRRLFASGWFDRVDQVRRSGNDEIEVTAEFLVPFAMVYSGDEYHVIDSRGRRLPLAYGEGMERPNLPLIMRVAMPKPAEAGSAWIGQDLRASLKLIGLIRTKPWFGTVHSVDAGRFNRESILELVTDRSTRVIWGNDPDARSLGEMPTERKLACLDALWSHAKRIDNGTGRGVDLRFDVVTLAPAETVPNPASAPVSAQR